MRRFVAELRRRRVPRAAVAYAVATFVVLQVADLVFPALDMPPVAFRVLVVLSLFGFPLAMVLSWVFDLTPQGFQRDPGAPSPASETVATGASADVGPKAAQATEPASSRPAMAGPGELVPGHGQAPPSPSATRSAIPIPASPPPPRSIAVLPFANLSTDPENEYFSEGLSAELLSALAKVPALRVSARRSSFAFRGSTEDVREIGQRLGVATIVEGTVRRSGDKVRVAAQLVDTEDGYHLWSDSYDAELADIFTIQEDMAQRIASALEVKLGEAVSCATTPPPADVHAYEVYLRGRYYLYTPTQKNLRRSVQLFRRAVELDPSYPLAHSGLADALSFTYLWMNPDPALLLEAGAAAHEALTLDDEIAESHVSAGQVLALQRRYDEAAQEYERALSLCPTLFEARYSFGRLRILEGRLEEAAELLGQAHESRPDDYQTLALRAQSLQAVGRTEEANADAVRALEVAQRQLELDPDDVRAVYMSAHCLVQLGRIDEGVQAIERALAMAPEDNTVLYNVACLFGRIGDKERAIEILQRCAELGSMQRDWVVHDPDLVTVRDDPRVVAILERLP